MTRVGLSGITSYWAIRAAVRDSPEDFIQRIESGLDEETVRGLRRGLQALRDVAGLQTVALVAALLGSITIALSFATGRFLGVSGELFYEAGLGLWLVAAILFIASLLVLAARFRDVHRVEAFVEAMRRSSLARDLA